MATSPTLPPQAYTREFLTSAFNWLQTQPESVRKAATSPDALVALFRRAQRYGASSLEMDAPVSSQNFMSDLKNLAEGLKQFDGPEPKIAVPNPGSAPTIAQTLSSAANSFQDLLPQPSAAPLQALNERARQMIQEVKTELNLSSDTEAINMMVSLAYKSLKNLLA
jgi:hypothetical protein